MPTALLKATAASAPPPPGTSVRNLFDVLARFDEDPRSVVKTEILDAADACGIELSASDVQASKATIAAGLRDRLREDSTPTPVVEVEIVDEETEKKEKAAPKVAPALARAKSTEPKHVPVVGLVDQVIRCCGQKVRVTKGVRTTVLPEVYLHLKKLGKVKRAK